MCLGGSEERFPDPVSIHVEQRSSSWRVGREIFVLDLPVSVMLLVATCELASITVGPIHYVAFYVRLHLKQLVQGAAAPKRIAENKHAHHRLR